MKNFAARAVPGILFLGCAAGLIGPFASALAQRGEVSPAKDITVEVKTFSAAADLLQERCALCHAGPNAERGLRLERDQIYRHTINVVAKSDRRRIRVVAGDPNASLLYQVLLDEEQRRYPIAVPRMPQRGPPLSGEELAIVRAWIESFPRELWGTPSSPTGPQPKAAQRIFHDSHLANLPTPDRLGRRRFEFRIAHRFKTAASDAKADELYGLDSGAWISLGLTFGLSKRVEAGLRHTNFQQAEEGFVKVSIVEQKRDGPPVSLSFQGGVSHLREDNRENTTRESAQVIIGRRVNKHLSLMAVPIYVSNTNYLNVNDTDGTLALGLGGELRFRPHMALTGEWIGQIDGVDAPYQSVSVGFSVGSPRHGFHLILTNTEGIHTDLYAPGGDLDFGDGDFRLGFSITRVYGRP